MDEDKEVQAVFAFQMTLIVNHGTGSGTYDEGCQAQIAATIPPKHRFVRWTGDTDTVADVEAAETTITMDANYEVTATFERIVYPIEVALVREVDFVYQNTPVTTKDRHKIVLTIDVTADENENGEYEVEVEQVGGDGEVIIKATANPLVWEIIGSRRGVGRTGEVNLEVRLTGDVAGETLETLDLAVRRLGDITGDGYINLRDKLAMVKHLNGIATPEPPRAFDLDGDGTAGAIDRQIMNALMNGFAIP